MSVSQFAEKISGINWTIIISTTVITEGAKQEIMFFLGAAAALTTIASRLYDMYHKHKEKNKPPENKL